MAAAERRESAGLEVLHLEVGQPSTPAPATARAAVVAALDVDRLGYTTALGRPELRARISAWYAERHGVEVPPARIMVTTGASGSCVLAFLALWDAGDRVAVFEPGYPCYRNDLRALGVEPVGVPLRPEAGFRPSLDDLEAVHGTEPLQGLVVASPSNPTGTVLGADDLGDLLAWAADRGVRVVVDEIYHGITYDRPAPSALELSDDVVVFNSFSKYFSMTGWRLGWIVAPETAMVPLERLGQNLAIAAPTVSQVAGLAAFDGIAECEANVARYAANRTTLLEGLSAAGLDRVAPPDGAFYVWADVSHLGIPSPDLCARWLDQLGVATTPGIDFDPPRGGDFVRFSYAGSSDEVARACERLADWRP